MGLEAYRQADVVVIRLTGEIDLSNVDDLRARVLREIPNTLDNVVIDLTPITYLDSQGIKLILEVHEGLAKSQREVRFVAPAGSLVGEILQIAGFPTPIDSSLAAAIERASAVA